MNKRERGFSVKASESGFFGDLFFDQSDKFVRRHGPHVALIPPTDGGEAVFTNTAAGLDDLQVGRLFDRFFSVEAARNSTGLGLAISRTLVEQMNGTIRAWYADGKLHIAVAFPDGAKGKA